MKRVLAIVVVASIIVGALGLSGCASTRSEVTAPDELHSVVPDVVGQSEAAAQEALVQAGFELGEVTSSPGGEPGVVVSQDPVAGTSNPRSNPVDLVVGE